NIGNAGSSRTAPGAMSMRRVTSATIVSPNAASSVSHKARIRSAGSPMPRIVARSIALAKRIMGDWLQPDFGVELPLLTLELEEPAGEVVHLRGEPRQHRLALRGESSALRLRRGSEAEGEVARRADDPGEQGGVDKERRPLKKPDQEGKQIQG